MAKKKRYTMKTACPQCGCSYAQVLTKEELEEKYGDVPNIHVECGECLAKYEADRREACPEWDEECRMKA